jgi:uncharacterized membrane protein YedE/YeeE
MRNIFVELSWSPYAVGIGIGILSWFTFLISKKPLACSTTFAKASGMLEQLFRGKSVALKPYYQQLTLKIDWQWMLVIGIIIGAFISSLLSGDFSWQWLPDMWRKSFGDNPITRIVAALIGGIFLGFGARFADGCTSGHGISGTLQLSVSSWLSVLSFFVGGVLMAHVLFVWLA